MGLQKRSLQDTICNKDYATFTPALMRAVRNYLNRGGKLLCSGSYVGADMISELKDESFTAQVLHYRWEGPLPSHTDSQIRGIRSKANIRRAANNEGYGVTKPDVLSPVGIGQRMFTYTDSGLSAGVGFKDLTCATLTSFVFSLSMPLNASMSSDRSSFSGICRSTAFLRAHTICQGTIFE